MTCTKLDLFFRRVTLWQRPMGPQELFHQRKREKKTPNSESPTFLNTSHTSVVSQQSLWSVPESCQPGPCPGCAAGNQFCFVWGMHKLRHVRPEQEPACSPCTSRNVPADVVAGSVCKKHWCSHREPLVETDWPEHQWPDSPTGRGLHRQALASCRD